MSETPRGRHEPVPQPGLPPLAVVVIGRNEGDRLLRCLESVRAMDYPAALLQITYVDSSSSDGSVALAESLGVRTLVLEGETTAARGRNAGWRDTPAPFVLFLDGDTLLDPGFPRRALAQFQDPRVAGVFGDRRESDTAGSLYNAVFDLDWPVFLGPAAYFGGDALVRVDALRAAGGYNPALIAGEEPDLCRRLRGLGFTILHIDAPMTLHDLDMHRPRQYWRRCLRTGYAFAEISSVYAATSDPLWLAESRANITRGLCWTTAPIVALVATLLLLSALPFVLFLAAAALLIGRTAARIRPRAASWKQALAYGLHSHLQQIPILLGQTRFWLARAGARKSGLIEYKSQP